MYAGVDGNKTTQGNPPKLKCVAARRRRLLDRAPTPCCAAATGSTGRRSTTRRRARRRATTARSASRRTPFVQQTAPDTPTVTLDNPFPTGVLQPSGNSRGALSGVGTNVSFVDQNRTAPRVQQWSADLQRELGAGMALTFSYMRRARRSSAARRVERSAGQHQPARSEVPGARRRGAQRAAAEPVPRQSQRAGRRSRRRATLTPGAPADAVPAVHERQRPAGDSKARTATTPASSNGASALTHGWGGRVSYTYSVLKDNQLGETNFYSAVGRHSVEQLQLQCLGAGVRGWRAVHDRLLRSEGGVRLQHPRRAAPRHRRADVRAAVRQGQEVTRTAAAWRTAIIGGWSIASITTWQAGFPLNVVQSNPNSILGGNTGARGRTSIRAPISPPPGDYDDRLASADHPTATWINPAAFSLVPFGTFGNAPRTITDLRTPTQFNTDVVFMKNFRLGGSQGGAGEARSAEPVQPADGSRPAGQQHVRARQQLRPDDAAVRVHADHAVHVPPLVLVRARIGRGRSRDRPLRKRAFGGLLALSLLSVSSNPWIRFAGGGSFFQLPVAEP